MGGNNSKKLDNNINADPKISMLENSIINAESRIQVVEGRIDKLSDDTAKLNIGAITK